jgi:aryl-alcohol dehydrogenase-like predicted oxidoreductase
MQYSQLGKTDIQVSKICLGTMTFGEQNTEAEGHEQIEYALSQGINFIDTAEMYSVPGTQATQGSTERIIGTWLAKNPSKRKDIVLASKVTGPSEVFSYIAPDMRFTKKRIEAAIENNLSRLQTDYIDVYQLHWPERKTNFFGTLGYNKHDAAWQDNFEETLATLNQLQKSGKIRHWGLSNETPWGLMRTSAIANAQNYNTAVSIQNPYNLLNRSYEIGLAEISIREQIGLLAYSPLGFGLLTGKFHKKLDTPNCRINKFTRLARYNSALCHNATQQYLNVAEQSGISLTHMALAFVNQQPFVTSNIIGATSLTQLKENIESIHITLSADIISQIETIHNSIPNPAP